MQSMEPVPGNLWPREMLITVEDGARPLLDLLWIREAYGLQPEGDDLPPLLLATPAPERPASDAPLAAWADGWSEVWRAALGHAALPRDPQMIQRLSTPTLDPALRSTLLDELFGPTWQDTFGDDALTPDHEVWDTARAHERMAPERHRSSPEHDCVDALVPAWRAGLTTIVELPCRGVWSQRVGDHGLAVTTDTRTDRTAYADALRTFS